MSPHFRIFTMELFSFLQEGEKVDHRVHIIAKCETDVNSPAKNIGFVVSAAYIAVDIIDDCKFAIVLEEHVAASL